MILEVANLQWFITSYIPGRRKQGSRLITAEVIILNTILVPKYKCVCFSYCYTKCNIKSNYSFKNCFSCASLSIDTWDSIKYDRRQTTPRVWHKRPTGEPKKLSLSL